GTGMSTLLKMKQRIAREVARSDLGEMIGDAINDAIDAYQYKRFYFNETREITFDTTPGQEFYDKNDHEAIPNLYKIDYIKVVVNNVLLDVERVRPEDHEEHLPAEGEPTSFSYYEQMLR